jgi:tetratricopeptide (TPR) repeat protein
MSDTPLSADDRAAVNPLHRLLVMIGLAVAVVALYLPTAGADFVSLDDPQYITDNPLVARPSFDGVRRVFVEVRHPSTVAGYYQPLTMVSLMVDSWWQGADDIRPFAYHLTNILLHAANTVLVYWIAAKLAPGLIIPLLAAALFAAHPVQVESVAWISQRKTVLAAFFALLSLGCWIESDLRRRSSLRHAAFAAYLLAVLAKPTVLPLPLLFVLLDYRPLKRLNRAALREKWPFFVVMAVAAVVTVDSQSSAGLTIPNFLSPAALLGLLQLSCYNLALYAKNLVWPVNLSLIYPLPPGLLDVDLRLVAITLATLAAVGIVVIGYRRWPILFVGVLGAGFLLAPTLGPVRFMQSCVGDRFLYLPLAWLLLIALGGAGKRLRSSVFAAPLAIAAAVVALALAGLTRAHQAVWASDEPLWTRVLRTAPDSPLANAALAEIRYAQQRFDEARDLIARAIEGEPDKVEHRLLYADALLQLDRPREALEQTRRALEQGLGDRQWRGHLMAGLALLHLDDLPAAQDSFQLVQPPETHRARIAFAIGSAYLKRNLPEQALPHLLVAEEKQPDDPFIRENLAAAFVLLGDLSAAEERYQASIRLRAALGDTGDPPRLALAKLYLDQGRIDEAESLLRALTPIHSHIVAEMDFGLAAVHAARGQLDEAFRLLARATNLEPVLAKRALRKAWFEPLHDDPRWAALVEQP